MPRTTRILASVNARQYAAKPQRVHRRNFSIRSAGGLFLILPRRVYPARRGRALCSFGRAVFVPRRRVAGRISLARQGSARAALALCSGTVFARDAVSSAISRREENSRELSAVLRSLSRRAYRCSAEIPSRAATTPVGPAHTHRRVFQRSTHTQWRWRWSRDLEYRERGSPRPPRFDASDSAVLFLFPVPLAPLQVSSTRTKCLAQSRMEV